MLDDITRNNSDTVSRRLKHHELHILLKKQKALVCQLDAINKQIQELTDIIIMRPSSFEAPPTHSKLIPKYFEVNNRQPSFRRLSAYTNDEIDCKSVSKWNAFLCCFKKH